MSGKDRACRCVVCWCGFWDWISYGGILVAAIIIAIDTAIAQSDDLKRYIPRISKIRFMGFLPLFAVLLSACSFIYKETRPAEFYLPDDAEAGSPFSFIQAWGVDNGIFYIVAKTDTIKKDNPLSKIFLVVRIPYAERDRMTDQEIAKSQPYTISGGFTTLAIPIVLANRLKVLPDRPTPIEFSLVEISFLFSPDQVHSLSYLTKLGGKILATTQVVSMFAPTPPALAPQVVCPPTPSPPAQAKKT